MKNEFQVFILFFRFFRSGIHCISQFQDTCIVDWKTSSAKWAVGKADKDLQATAFCYAFKAKHGEKPLFSRISAL